MEGQKVKKIEKKHETPFYREEEQVKGRGCYNHRGLL